MASFIGEYTCKLDDKGRVPFPAGFRPAAMGADGQVRVVAKKDLFTACLTLMTEGEWEKQLADINTRLNAYNPQHQALRREIFRNMASLELDAAGRILLPKKLIELVGIGKEVVFAGQGDKIELWAKEEYDKTLMPVDDVAGLAATLLGGV